MTEQNAGLLTPEEVMGYSRKQAMFPIDWCEAQLAKLTKLGWMSPDECQECQAQTECNMEPNGGKIEEILR